jgi:hypothetical protein
MHLFEPSLRSAFAKAMADGGVRGQSPEVLM